MGHLGDVVEAVDVGDVHRVPRTDLRAQRDGHGRTVRPCVDPVQVVDGEVEGTPGVGVVGALDRSLNPPVLRHQLVIDVLGPTPPLGLVYQTSDVLKRPTLHQTIGGGRLVLREIDRNDVFGLNAVHPRGARVQVVQRGLEHQIPVGVLVELVPTHVGHRACDVHFGLVRALPEVHLPIRTDVRGERL